MDAGAIQGHLEPLQLSLVRPLLVMKAPKGTFGCDYTNVETCNKTGEACAIVTRMSTFDDAHKTKVVVTSNKTVELSIQVSESDQDALNKMRWFKPHRLETGTRPFKWKSSSARAVLFY